jgi:glycosyltransferase involved in cell wall biosynthesis
MGKQIKLKIIMQRRYKILISAYACSPRKGSEPGMGWNFVKALAQYHELHIITEIKWKNDLDTVLDRDLSLSRNIKFYYLKKKRNRPLRKIWPPSYYYFYKVWQKKVYRLAAELDKVENFDIVHHLNMVGYREPGYLWKMNKPFVWGPLGGMQDVHFKLLFNLDISGMLFYTARLTINNFQKRFSQRLKKAAQRERTCLIAATEADRRLIQKYWHTNSVLIPEVGQELLPESNIVKRKPGEPLKIVWSGQHTAGKALNILLKCLREFPRDANWHLSILGTGRMTKKWQAMAVKYNINDRCTWHNWLEKKDAHLIMQASHVLCITSLKDLTSTVTLEGLSFGLPVVCIDHCGFGNVINENCGIKIPVDYPWNLVHNFKKALELIYSDELFRQKLATGALRRAGEFCWDHKAGEINIIYNSLLNHDELNYEKRQEAMLQAFPEPNLNSVIV